MPQISVVYCEIFIDFIPDVIVNNTRYLTDAIFGISESIEFVIFLNGSVITDTFTIGQVVKSILIKNDRSHMIK
jgi:hypothetical protein